MKGMTAALMLAGLATACGDSGASAGIKDPVWYRDSSVLAEAPGVVFRSIDLDEERRAVVPVVLMGQNNLHPIEFGGRGWRLLDSLYLTAGSPLLGIRDGRSVETVRTTRRMWEPSGPLDSLPGCRRFVPAGLAGVPRGIDLLVGGTRPPVRNVTPISSGALAEALSSIPTLIAPGASIPTRMLSRYTREVHVVPSGATDRSTLVVIYNDPEQVADSVIPLVQRPRHMVLVLDQGVYGYQPTFTYTTLGNARTPPRLKFLDYLDVDGDGVAELFFGARRTSTFESTVILRSGKDQNWREVFNLGLRCQL